MAGTIFNGTYPNGISLSNSATQNPATIASTGTVTNTGTANGSHAIYGQLGTAWTIFNYGNITGFTTATSAVYFASGGSLTNGSSSDRTAEVVGAKTAITMNRATGTITNFGTLFATLGSTGIAANIGDGGTITNEANALILGAHTGANVAGKPGTVNNFGTIQSTSTVAGGVGVYLSSGGQVSNRAGALVFAYNSAIDAVTAAATVTNYGSISNSGKSAAIDLNAGGAVTNQTGGYIASSKNPAILVQTGAATLVNSGKIVSGAAGSAAYFGGSANVTNSGTISLGPAGTALDLKVGGTVANSGQLLAASGIGLSIGSAAVATSATATVTNSASALISGLVGVAVSGLDSGKSTIVNYGTITGANGVGVFFGNGADTLVIEPNSVLNGALANFAPSDVIDFAHKVGNAATFSYGVLSLTSGGTVVGTIALSGAFSGTGFSVVSDGAGGTDVKVSAAALPNDLTGNGISDTLMTSTNNGALVVGEMSGGSLAFKQIGGLGSEWQFGGTGELFGDGRDGFLIWAGNSTLADYGALVVGEDVGGTVKYTQVGAIGPEWSFEGVGSLAGGADADFLLWDGNSSSANYGALVVGSINNVTAQYTQIGAIGPEWQFEGVGNYVGNGASEFLIWDTSTSSSSYSDLVLGQDINGTAQYTAVGALDPATWVFEGTGDLLNDGKSSFLLLNKNTGALVAGEVVNGATQGTQIGAVGSEWQFLGIGDYDGRSPAEFLMRSSTNGAVVLGTVANGQATYVQVSGVGPEWNFHTSSPALVV